MAEIGSRLRAARESLGLSIDRIAAATKIQRAMLEAIERDQFELLPGDPFTRGFLRAYAREVRLDPESILKPYRERTPDAQPVIVTVPAPASTFKPTVDSPTRMKGFLTLAMAAAALVFLLRVPAPSPPADPGMVATSGISEKAPAPAAQSPPPKDAPVQAPAVSVAAPAASVPPPAVPISMEVEPSGLVWVEAMADGHRVAYQLVNPGERLALQAEKELTIRVGDAGAFRYVLNGESGRSLGGPGEIRDLVISPANVAEYQLARADAH